MKVKVGFLGAGFIARYHALQLALSDIENEIVAVYDEDIDRATSFTTDEGGRVATSVDDVIAASDAVFVCTWTAAHLDCVRRVVQAGRPVFCEKPLSKDLAEATRLVDLVVGSGVVNMAGLVLRSSPALLAVRELARRDEAGQVLNVVFRDDQYIPTQGMYESTWRGDRDLAGSGVLLEHSIHDVDLLEWLCGPIKTVSVQQSNFHGLAGIEDSISALCRFESGATATLGSVWHDVLSRPSQRRIEVFCERALITLEGDIFGPVSLQTSDGVMSWADDDLVDWLGEGGVELESAESRFLRAVRVSAEGGTAIRLDPDVQDALRAHLVVDRMYESARAGGILIDVTGGS